MWTRAEIEERLKHAGLEGQCWGRVGSKVVCELETSLGFSLSENVRLFGEQIGNLMVDPFNIIITGGEEYGLTCVTESHTIGIIDDNARIAGVKIMDHAGESYVAIKNTDIIEAYDSVGLKNGEWTLHFNSFLDFIEWVFAEAKANAK